MSAVPFSADSVVDAIEQLRADGYTDDLDIHDLQMRCQRTGECYDLASATVDRQYRFEGDTDPADESLVLGVTIAGATQSGRGLRAVLVTAYGPDTPPEIADFLRSVRRWP